MKQIFMNLIDNFDSQLSESLRNNYLPILRSSFAPYILEKHRELNNIDKLFLDEITPEDIINAGIYYVDNTKKVKNTSAVNKYLSAVSEFYNKVIYPKYPTCGLARYKDDFQEFRNEIVKKCHKDLKFSVSHEHLTKMDYSVLKEYLNNYNRGITYKELINIVICKLILLYGFKIGIITDLNKDDYSVERNTLRILSNTNEPLILELPYTLSQEIKMVIEKSGNISKKLFETEDGQGITSSYADDELKKICISMKKTSNESKKFTTTSLSKYAVIEMFIKGINPTIISQISGMKDVNLKYCQEEANSRLYQYSINRYINSKTRDIATYDDFN